MAPSRSRLRRDESSRQFSKISKHSEKKKESSQPKSTQKSDKHSPWAPSAHTAFKALLSARLCAAVWSGISDCDETYNYWEPTHYLLYGSGLQTWEYSPAYALRSYAYLWIQALPGSVYSLLLQSNKILVFYFIRCVLSIFSALCEVYFYRGVCLAFGGHVGRLLLTLLIFSSGMFVASCAYLPSTFAMHLAMLMWGAWYRNKNQITIASAAASALVGWPFAVILGVPIAYDIILVQKKFLSFIKWSLISLAAITIPLVLIDSRYYGRLVVAPLNIVLYNVFSEHGPDIYGVEPWTFYFLNGFLNFNLVFVLALLAAPILLIHHLCVKRLRFSSSRILTLCALYLWMIVFFTRPHKEERFLFPIYPLFCLAAAMTLDIVQKLLLVAWVGLRKRPLPLDSTNWVAIAFIILSSLMSLSRSVALYKGYHAPMELFMELSSISQTQQEQGLLKEGVPVQLCIGKEWHRFPSHFFMPHGWSLQFVRSEFKGQLPKHFDRSSNATRLVPDHMNDQNREEPSRYVELSSCQYLVDGDFPASQSSVWEPQYSHKTDQWRTLASIPFLDPRRSSRLLRAFYVPFLSENYCSFVPYNLLQRINK